MAYIGRAGIAMVVGVVVLAAHGPADADLTLPGQRYRRTDARIDLGPYADHVTRVHVVAKGDTLGDLAKRHLGSARRWEEIRDLNPGLKPDALPVGSRILLPPKAPPGGPGKEADEPGWWDLLLVSPPGKTLEYVTADEDLRWGPYGCWLLAVRHDKLPALREMLSKQGVFPQPLVEDLVKRGTPWIARTKGEVAGRTSVPEDDPVWRVHVERRITGIAGGVIALEDVRTTYFDRDGRAMSAAEVAAARKRWNVLFVALAAAGAAGVWLVLRRRRRAVRASSIA